MFDVGYIIDCIQVVLFIGSVEVVVEGVYYVQGLLVGQVQVGLDMGLLFLLDGFFVLL